jgi:regulator of protease activity HflC (stomatin/prohibitin superfamily)
MLLLRSVLYVASLCVLAGGVAALGRRAWMRWAGAETPPSLWRAPLSFAALAALLALTASGIVVVPAGSAGVRVSQLWGVRPGVLRTGVHFVPPLVEDVVLYDVRDRVLTAEGDALSVQSKEGLNLALAISVRYRLEPSRLPAIHAHLPQPVETQVVPPVVTSAFRQLVPNYMVRDIFATQREEIREKASEIIAKKLGADGIVVQEVMLRNVVLPPEYAKGLEGLLLREQQNERMVYDIQIKEKEVRSAELEAEAQKARQVKQAEAAAQVRVLQAKSEADAMQYTLPLKQKQIEQTRLEAEAQAQAKLIDTKAEVERRNLLAGADAQRTRVMAAADAERMRLESDILAQNPLLIQKIVAERLSDKMQIMMVPMDGQNFFASDVLRSSLASSLVAPAPSRKEGGVEAAPGGRPAHLASNGRSRGRGSRR